MHIKTILKRTFYNFVPTGTKFVQKNLCGVSLEVLPGTIRDKVDQDDAWWFYLSKHHNVIFDIGCNIGYTALLALVQNPNKQLVLVDPNPKALQNAAANIIENQMGNKVHYLSAFVGNSIDETVKFYTVGSGAAGSMHASHAETASAMNSFMEVKTITLDNLFSYYEISPDLVKIDVEGAETMVMEGAKKLAKSSQCTFFIEMHKVDGLGMEGAGQLMLDWCKEMNYKAWYLKTANELSKAETIKDRGKCHLLLMPKQKLYPCYLEKIKQNDALPKSV